MRRTPLSRNTLRTLIIGWAVPLIAQQAPCPQITAACKNAGFTQGGASSGTGLQDDCIIPIIQGIAQPAAATRPLPQVDPNVVAACKAHNPEFGAAKAPSTAALAAGAGAVQPSVQPSLQPAAAVSAQPSVQAGSLKSGALGSKGGPPNQTEGDTKVPGPGR
jgi:hypothetical protein